MWVLGLFFVTFHFFKAFSIMSIHAENVLYIYIFI